MPSSRFSNVLLRAGREEVCRDISNTPHGKASPETAMHGFSLNMLSDRG